MESAKMASMIGRPHATEAAPHYFTYINQVISQVTSQVIGDDPISPISIMELQLEESLAFFRQISEETSLHRYMPEKWSIRQVLNHVNDTERALAFRALWFARGFETPLPGYDADIAASGAEAGNISWASQVDEFRRVRLSTISLFQNLPDEAWTKGGGASDNFFTVRALAWIIAGHIAHHASILRERYL